MDNQHNHNFHILLNFLGYYQFHFLRKHPHNQNNNLHNQYMQNHKNVVVWSMPEIVRTAAAFREEAGKLGTEVKKTFPGISVTEIRQKGMPNDEIPF